MKKTKEQNKYYNDQYKEKKKVHRLKVKYGISLEDYGELLYKQNGVCAICFKHETALCNSIPKMLAVDHDHETNEVRGLLCQKCNTALGSFSDSLELLENAKEYLIKNK